MASGLEALAEFKKQHPDRQWRLVKRVVTQYTEVVRSTRLNKENKRCKRNLKRK